MPTDLLTAEQVAEIFSVPISTVQRWARDGQIAGFKTPGGRGWRFKQTEVEKFLPSEDERDEATA